MNHRNYGIPVIKPSPPNRGKTRVGAWSGSAIAGGIVIIVIVLCVVVLYGWARRSPSGMARPGQWPSFSLQISMKSDSSLMRPGGCSWRKITSLFGPLLLALPARTASHRKSFRSAIRMAEEFHRSTDHSLVWMGWRI
jgi:hypothetical protein